MAPIAHLAQKRRIALAGRIKLGIKVKSERSGAEYPKEVEYFVVPESLEKYDPARFTKPTSLDVIFPSNDLDVVLDAWYERYAGRKGNAGGLLTLRCDGRTYQEIPTNVNAPIVQGACRRPPAEQGKAWPKCVCEAEPKARLRFLLVHGPVGVYQIGLGGHQRIETLLEDLMLRKAEFGDRLTGIPFVLTRRSEMRNAPDSKGERIPTEGWPVRVESNFTLLQAMRARGFNPFVLGGEVTGQPASAQLSAAPIILDATADDEEDDDLPPAPEEEDHTYHNAVPREAPTAAVTDDISVAFSLAQAAGIPAADYILYIQHKYPKPSGDPATLDDLAGNTLAIAAERAMFEAGTEPAEQVRQRVAKKVAALRKQGRL